MKISLVENFTYTLTLPESVYPSVWLIPLIDGRLRFGRPANYDRPGKPDNTSKLFGDWDILNVLNLTPPQILVSMIVPTTLAFCTVLLIQFGFIFYIQEVMRGKVDEHCLQGEAICYGVVRSKWDSNNSRILRVICLLTFLTEIIRVRLQHRHLCRCLVTTQIFLPVSS